MLAADTTLSLEVRISWTWGVQNCRRGERLENEIIIEFTIYYYTTSWSSASW
jgi:hypothetical protein